MSSDQIDLIVNNSEWNEERKEWAVPFFTYKERNVALPKLNKLNNTGMYKKDSIELEKEKKELKFREKETIDRSGETGFRMN